MLNKQDLHRLVEAKVVDTISIIPLGDNFIIKILVSENNEETLATARNTRREFKTVDAAYKVAKDVGLSKVTLYIEE